jgi:hypothetical protein
MRKSKELTAYSKHKNKSVLFFSASSTGDFQQLYDFGIREMLVSYFYLKKSLAYYDKMLPLIKEQGGLFMTDSGAFSFASKFGEGTPEYEEARHEKFWIPYLEEYIAWIREHKKYIFCAANLDIDSIVGQEVVHKWNQKYFEPLEKDGIQIVYVAHEGNVYSTILDSLKYYMKRYEYVGVNQVHKEQAAKIYQLAKYYNRRIHGFAWTEFDLLKRYPFFSADSVTWLGGVRFGTTYDYDGKNFRTIDYKRKYLRKANRYAYEQIGVDIDKVTKTEDRTSINKMNLLGWMGFRKEVLKYANLKLTNKVVSYYENK